MSNKITSNIRQAGLTDRETIISTTGTPESGSSGITQALVGFEEQESLIRELHAEWLCIRRRSVQVAIKLGGILAELKAELKKSRTGTLWERYVSEHLGIDPRTASNYMRIHHEASTVNGMLGLINSEMVSEMGIREVLDYLANLKKANIVTPDEQATDNGSETDEVIASHKAPGQPPILLLDGSQINLVKLKWKDGLVTRDAIQTWMSASADTTDKLTIKNEARRQRFVIQIAAEINRACGRGDKATAKELVESSLDAFRMILSNSLID